MLLLYELVKLLVFAILAAVAIALVIVYYFALALLVLISIIGDFLGSVRRRRYVGRDSNSGVDNGVTTRYTPRHTRDAREGRRKR